MPGIPRPKESKLGPPSLPCCPDFDYGGGGEDSSYGGDDSGYQPPNGRTLPIARPNSIVVPQTSPRVLPINLRALGSPAAAVGRVGNNVPPSFAQGGSTPRVLRPAGGIEAAARTPRTSPDAIYDATAGYFRVNSSYLNSLLLRSSGGDEGEKNVDEIMFPFGRGVDPDGAEFIPEITLAPLRNVPTPKWLECGGFYWYMWLSAKTKAGSGYGARSWIIQHIVRHRYISESCTSHKWKHTFEEYWEGFLLTSGGDPIRGTKDPDIAQVSTPAQQEGTHDTSKCEEGDCYKTADWNFASLGRVQGWPSHGYDKLAEPPHDGTCGYCWALGTMFWQAGVPWEMKPNAIADAGPLPASRTKPDNMPDDGEALASRFIETEWDCCCDRWVRGTANWHQLPSGMSQDYWMDSRSASGNTTQAGAIPVGPR